MPTTPDAEATPPTPIHPCSHSQPCPGPRRTPPAAPQPSPRRQRRSPSSHLKKPPRTDRANTVKQTRANTVKQTRKLTLSTARLRPDVFARASASSRTGRPQEHCSLRSARPAPPLRRAAALGQLRARCPCGLFRRRWQGGGSEGTVLSTFYSSCKSE